MHARLLSLGGIAPALRGGAMAISLLACAVALVACGDDAAEPAGRLDGGDDRRDAAPPDDNRDSGDPTPDDAATADASGERDSGEPGGDADVDPTDEDGGEPESAMFEVPAGGGSFDYMTPSGDTITFVFPASAAGEDITFAVVDPDEVEWGDAQLADSFTTVIELGPDGLTFDDPIEIVAGGALIVFNFSERGGVPEPLELNADGDALLLTHFSTLAIVAPNQSCQSESGWDDTADSERCAGAGSATSYRHYGCKNYQFCYTIEAGCCVEPGDTDVDCRLGDAELTLAYNRTDSNGGQYPYCDVGLVVTPYVSNYMPDMLSATGADQVITLTGTGFDPNGSVFTNTDGLVATTWVSATQVTATIPGGQLGSAGSLNNVGYVNPTTAATGACSLNDVGNCDWVHRSNLVNIPIAAVDTDPTLTSIAPTELIANSTDQVITLTGTNFDPDGSAFTNLDGAIATTWVSATQVTATVPGSQLTTVGTLNDVGYVNPTSSATGACTAAMASNCDWANRSNVIDVTIAAPPAAGNPTVTDISPSMLSANSTDQVITITGTNFDPDGSAFTNLDSAIATTWVSATQVTATVPGSQLTATGTLYQVGYVNPTSSATGACSSGAPGNCDWANRSNTTDIPIN